MSRQMEIFHVTLMLYFHKQGCHFVRNVRNCQEFERFHQKVRKMSGKLFEVLVMSGKCQEFSMMC